MSNLKRNSYLAVCFLGLVLVVSYVVRQEQSPIADGSGIDGDKQEVLSGEGQPNDSAHTDPVTKEDLLEHRCQVLAIDGADDETGILVVESGDGSTIYFLDANGTQELQKIGFFPNHTRIGSREDGSSVIGVGYLRLNSKERRDSDSPEPVRILFDNQEIFAGDKVFDFGVSNDGSSYFVIEPTSSGNSRLVLSNLDIGVEHHIDLGTARTPYNDEVPIMVQYAANGDEILLLPSDSSSLAAREFISTTTGQKTTFVPPADTKLVGSVFESSEVAYMVEAMGDKEYGLSKVSLETSNHGGFSTIWSRSMRLQNFYGGISLSDDARWLILRSWDILVIRADTGETIFEWPLAGDKDVERRRLSSVLPENASRADITAGLANVQIRNGKLLLTRKLGLDAFTSCHTTPDPAGCMQSAKSEVREVIDVFEMSTIEIDSVPDYRAEVKESFGCQVSGSRLAELIFVNGDLEISRQEQVNNAGQ